MATETEAEKVGRQSFEVQTLILRMVSKLELELERKVAVIVAVVVVVCVVVAVVVAVAVFEVVRIAFPCLSKRCMGALVPWVSWGVRSPMSMSMSMSFLMMMMMMLFV